MTHHTEAGQFWDLYFRNLLVRLEREGGNYRALAYADPQSVGAPIGFLRESKLRSVAVSKDQLLGYDYGADERFALLLKRPKTLIASLEAIISKTYPYRDAAPFGKVRMAELCFQLRVKLLTEKTDVSVTAGENILSQMIANYVPVLDQPIAALVWVLGEQRQTSSATVILDVIRYSPYVSSARQRLHFTSVDAAFSALWKINDKTKMWQILQLMVDSNDSCRRKLAALFERLLSTRDLLGLHLLGEQYSDPDFWTKFLEPFRSSGA